MTMQKKKIAATVIWTLAIVALIGIWRFIQYKVDMYYSQIAPSQVDDDSTYGQLQFQNTIGTIIAVIVGLLIFLILFQIYRIWSRRIV